MKKVNPEYVKILIIGSGGREFSIGAQLLSEGVENLYFSPGNVGTAELGKNIELDLKNFQKVFAFVKKYEIDLIVVGPEESLVNGIVDFFRKKEILIVGPTKEAAQIEGSKIFARHLNDKAGIPQPKYVVCSDMKSAEEAVKEFGLPVVLKVDGLAAGKGAFVCHNSEDIGEAFELIYKQDKFGQGSILVEECLVGQEMSVFVLCNNIDHTIIGTAQDYKRLLDGNKGPNTGGMGSISPSPLVEQYPGLLEEIEKTIVSPALATMAELGKAFTGFLYCGLMVTNGKPKVIEYNCRLGDPETQVVLQLIASSFFELLWSVANNWIMPEVDLYNLYAAFVFKVAEGYPGNYEKGNVITIGEIVSMNCDVIFAGTKVNDEGEIVTNGGRVIGAFGFGGTLAEAVKEAYAGVDAIDFKGALCRRDIGILL